LRATLPRGRDVGVSYAHAPASKPPSDLVTTHVYFDQRGCGKQRRWDIFRVNDTERLPVAPRAALHGPAVAGLDPEPAPLQDLGIELAAVVDDDHDRCPSP